MYVLVRIFNSEPYKTFNIGGKSIIVAQNQITDYLPVKSTLVKLDNSYVILQADHAYTVVYNGQFHIYEDIFVSHNSDVLVRNLDHSDKRYQVMPVGTKIGPYKGLSGEIYTSINNQVIADNKFETEKYMGQWYQIASIPQFFNQDCVGSMAEYSLKDDLVVVKNSCLGDTNQVIRTIVGSAKPVYPGALMVSFPQFVASQVNYIVHKTDYKSFSVVGSPNKSNAYILSRTKQMDKTDYADLVTYLKDLDYDVSKLKLDKNRLV